MLGQNRDIQSPLSARNAAARLTPHPTAATLPSLGEVAAMALAAVLVGLLFLPHIVGGGLYNDGWQYLDLFRFAPKSGFFGAVANFHEDAFRPGQMLYWPV